MTDVIESEYGMPSDIVESVPRQLEQVRCKKYLIMIYHTNNTCRKVTKIQQRELSSCIVSNCT